MGVGHQAHGWIRHMDRPFGDFIDDNEVLLIPMCDAWQRGFHHQPLERKFHRQAAQAQFFRRFRNPQHRHPRLADQTQVPQPRSIELASIVGANHAQTSRTAVHRIEL